MPVVINEFEAEITPETEPGAQGPAAAPGGAADPAAPASQPARLAWQATRELADEREARLATD